MMVQFQWLLPVLFSLAFGEIEEIVDITCTTRQGSAAIGVGATSNVACLAGEVLVSCGIKGTQRIGGARIDPNNENLCQALGHHASYSVYAEAVCCTLPSDSVSSIKDVASNPATSVSSVCPLNSVLTGCHVYYESGDMDAIKGSFSGFIGASSWIGTGNKCTAQSKSSNTMVTAQARCIEFADNYSLICETTVKYTNYATFGSCRADYDMFGCNTYTESNTLDSYYRNNDGKCYVQQDNHSKQFANAICCQLKKISPREKCDDDITDYNLLIILDESGSVQENNYKETIDFIIDLVKYDINDIAKLAVLSYSSTNDVVYKFSDEQNDDRASIINALNIEKNDYNGGETYTNNALKNGLSEFKNNVDSSENNLVLLFSDGKPSATQTVCDESNFNLLHQYRMENIRVIIVGIGVNFDSEPLSCIANNGDIYEINDFTQTQFLSIIDELRDEILCPKPQCLCK